MKHSRKIILAGAALSWGGVLAMVAIALAGVPDDADESRLFGFLLGAAITLSLSAMLAARVMDPRAAYRLGWDARGRHETAATVTELGKQGHG